MPKAADTSFLGKGRLKKAVLAQYVLSKSDLTEEEVDAKLHSELAKLAENLHSMSLSRGEENENESEADEGEGEHERGSDEVQGGITDSDNDEYVHFTANYHHTPQVPLADEQADQGVPQGRGRRTGRGKAMNQVVREQLSSAPPLFVESDSDQAVEGTGTTEPFGRPSRSRSQRRRKPKAKSQSKSRSRSPPKHQAPAKKKAASKKTKAPSKKAAGKRMSTRSRGQ